MKKKNIILCVDDEVNILKSLERVLRSPEIEVYTAATVAEGFAILEKHPVDLAIVDQRMPVMSGAEFLRKVRQKYPQMVRIMLSGHSDFNDLVKALNEGEICRFIAKPWKNAELKETVRTALAQQRVKLAIEQLFMNIGQMAHLAQSVSVEPLAGEQSILIRVQDHGKVFSRAALTDFLEFLFSSLGVEGREQLKTISGEEEKTGAQITMTIDLGKGLTLKVELPDN